MKKCNFCEKEFESNRSGSLHIRMCSKNPNRQKSWLETTFNDKRKSSEIFKSISSSNQFIKAKKANQVYIVSDETRLKFKAAASSRGQTDATKKKLSEIAKQRNLGGHTSKRRYLYVQKNGTSVNLQSSYELEFAQLLDDNNIDWTRPDPLNWVDLEGKTRRYYPDFKIGNVYFDTKNDFLAKKDEFKINSVRLQNSVDVYIVLKYNINIEFVRKALQA